MGWGVTWFQHDRAPARRRDERKQGGLGFNSTPKGVEGEEYLTPFLRLPGRLGQRSAGGPWVRSLTENKAFLQDTFRRPSVVNITKTKRTNGGRAPRLRDQQCRCPAQISMIRLMGPTAQVIVGGVKQDSKRKHSLQTLNCKPLNLNPKLYDEP